MRYRYLAYTEDKCLARGVQEALSEDLAASVLSHRGYKILSLKPVPVLLSGQEQVRGFFQKIPRDILVTFSRQFALLHDSGVDIISTLELLKDHAVNRAFKKILAEIIVDLSKGLKLSEAMAKYPAVFSRMYIQSIKIGEQTGDLEASFRQMADYLDRDVKSSKSVQSALRYPLIVLVVMAIVVIVLATFVLPSFLSLYKSLNVQLPATTQLLISLTDWFSRYGLFTLIALIIGIFLFYLWSQTVDGKLQKDQLALKIPILGHITHLSELARCCRSISVLYKAGLPVTEILLNAIDSSNNAIMRQALTAVHQSVLKGEGLARPMGENPLFLSMMVQMVSVGEKTGNLDKTLAVTAEAYETEAEDKLHTFIGLIQPAITIVIGLVVALIAISLVSAMYSIYGSIS